MPRDMLRDLLHRLRALFRRKRVETDLDDELQFHFERQVERNLASGLSPQEARRQARLAFGGLDQVKEECREARGVGFIETVLQDLRYALRQLAKSPGFTAVAVVSLALGIGANTAIFSLVDALILRALPVEEPERLVELLHEYPGYPRYNDYEVEKYEYLRDHQTAFTALIATSSPASSRMKIQIEGAGPETMDGEYVDARYFQVLGVRPALGRLIEPSDDANAAAGSAVAVVSWSYWEERFNLDPAVLGARITVDGFPATIVGVAPPEFFGVQVGYAPRIWLPLGAEAEMHRGGYRVGVRLLGRLKPGVSIEHAEAEMAVLYRRTLNEQRLRDDPLTRRMKFELEPAAAGLSHARDLFAQPLRFLMAVVGLLLLIACTNVAGMLLARGASREREMALRVSLGAARSRLLRQVLTESLTLSTVGGLLGMSVAYIGADVLLGIVAGGRQRVEILVQPDIRVLLFATGIVVLTGVLFGLVPALRAMAATPASSLRGTGMARETRFGRLFGGSLVVTQVALSVVLLSAAGLFLAHLSNLRNHLGFDRESTLVVTLDPDDAGYSDGELSEAYRGLLGRLGSIPGVRSATLAALTPISRAGESRLGKVEGYDETPGQRRWIYINKVAPKFFETLSTPFLAGRDFTDQDIDGPGVGIINQAMARYYFGEQSPIGWHVTFDHDPKPYRIIGVVGDTKYSEPTETPPPTMYLHVFQHRVRPSHQFALRSSVGPSTIAPDVRRLVQTEMADVRVRQIRTMADQVDAAIVPQRLIALLSALFGGLGLLLAAIGLYGLLAYTVARRTSEIGVRMALGATSGLVARAVLADALGLIAGGLAIGGVFAFWGRQLTTKVFADIALDSLLPIVIGGLALMAVGLLASYIPARRAARIAPMAALRNE